MTHTLSALVKNRPRVLARVAGLFARREFNIESLAVSTTEDPKISRMTIAVDATGTPLQQVRKQLSKLHDVVTVIDHTEEEVVERELCMVKVHAKPELRGELMSLAEIFRADIVDIGNGTIIVQCIGDSDKIDAFVDNFADYGIEEMVRTGKVVLARGRQQT
ncbi:MAG: acetolactate synthase small subunit [Armatimonadota bacterium]